MIATRHGDGVASAAPGVAVPMSAVIPVVLALVTALLYLPTLGHGFSIYDDHELVAIDPIRDGLNGTVIHWAFTIHGPSLYHPLTWLSHALDVEFFGHDAGGHHAVSVLIHAASGVLLYHTLLSMTGAMWRSAIAAALFAWHPSRVEAVAWVAERKEVLCGFFTILTLWAYVRYARQRSWGRYTVVLAAYLLALASKPMAVTLPALLLLVDYWPLGRLKRPLAPLIAEKLPLLIMALACAGLSFLCQIDARAIAPLNEVSFVDRLGNAVISYTRYLRVAVLPINLAVFYPRQQWAAWQVAACLSILLAVTGIAIASARKWRYAPVGWGWFLISLIPVIGILQIGGQAMADRYLYLPLIGIFVAMVWAGADASARMPAMRKFSGYLAALVLTGYAIATSAQVSHWRDDEALFTRAIAVTRKNYIAHNNLGVAYSNRGQWREAAQQYALAVAARPGYGDAMVNLGIAQQHLGATASAERNFRAVLQSVPQHYAARSSLGNLLAKSGRGPEALTIFEQLIRENANDVAARVNYGVALESVGDNAGAAAQYREALRLSPGDPEAQANLDRLLAVPLPIQTP